MEKKAQEIVLNAVKSAFANTDAKVFEDKGFALENDLRRVVDIVIESPSMGLILIEVKRHKHTRLISDDIYEMIQRIELIIWNYYDKYRDRYDVRDYPPIRAFIALPFTARQDFLKKFPDFEYLERLIFSDELDENALIPKILESSTSFERRLASPDSLPKAEPPTTRQYQIFISYRREDSQWAAGRIADRLASQYGSDEVFFDTRSISGGSRWRLEIENRIKSSNVLLVIIVENWLRISDPESGKRRLDSPQDVVKKEIGLGISEKLMVIPILIDEATMPRTEYLPAPLKELPELNALTVRAKFFERDVKDVIDTINSFIS